MREIQRGRQLSQPTQQFSLFPPVYLSLQRSQSTSETLSLPRTISSIRQTERARELKRVRAAPSVSHRAPSSLIYLYSITQCKLTYSECFVRSPKTWRLAIQTFSFFFALKYHLCDPKQEDLSAQFQGRFGKGTDSPHFTRSLLALNQGDEGLSRTQERLPDMPKHSVQVPRHSIVSGVCVDNPLLAPLLPSLWGTIFDQAAPPSGFTSNRVLIWHNRSWFFKVSYNLIEICQHLQMNVSVSEACLLDRCVLY